MALVGSVRRIVAALMVLMMMSVAARAQEINDYPTSARVEYVFGCLKANGETRQAIEQCSCSVDVIASLVPYARYVTAETVLSMSREIWAGSSGHLSRRQPHSTNSGEPRPKRKCAASDVARSSDQIPESSIFHSRWKTCP